MAIDNGVPLINGVLYSWASIKFVVGTVPVTGITAIKYDEKQNIVDEHGAGAYAVGRGMGNIDFNASITLLMEEIEALQKASLTGRLQDLGWFDIIVAFIAVGTVVTTHTLKNCQFKVNGRDAKQGDTKLEKELELAIGNILWK